MKTYLTILMVFFTISSFSQITGNIEKDTALARQYYDEGKALLIKDAKNERILGLLKKSVALYEVYPFSRELMESKVLLSVQYYNEGIADTAIATAEGIINLIEKEAPELRTDTVLIDAYEILAQLYVSQPDKCIPYRLKLLDCTQKGSKKYFEKVQYLIFDYANHYMLEELDALLIDLEKLLDNQKDETLSKYWITIYYGKILMYKKLRNYEQAVLYSKKLFIDNEKHKVIPTYQLAPMYMDMGIFLTRLNEYDEAIEWAEKGIQSRRYESPGQAGSFHSTFAFIYLNQKKYRKAIAEYEKAIPMFEKEPIRFKTWLVNAYNSIAAAYSELKEHDKVIEAVEKSKEYGLTPIQNYRLGLSYGEQGKYEIAIKELQQAIVQYATQFKSLNIDKNPSIYEVFKNARFAHSSVLYKGKLEYKWGKEDKSKDRLLKSYETLKIAYSYYETVAKANKGFDKSRFLVNQDLLEILASMILVQSELYELEPNDEIFKELLQLTERRKALQLIETLSPSTLPKELAKKEQILLKEINYYGQKLDLADYSNQEDSIVFYRNAIVKTNQKLEKHFETIKANYPKVSEDFYNNQYATLNKIQSNLSDNTLLIEYNLLNDDKGLAIIVGQDYQKKISIDYSSLSSNIKKLNELIQDRFAFQTPVRNEFIDVSHELYNTLIKPIESELEGKTELMIVVEGKLFHLPFELLLKSNEKKPYQELNFLIKDYAINYHYSATAFLKLQEKSTVKDNSLLAFAPVFSRGEELNEATRSLDFLIDSLYSGIDGDEFVALPSTKKEIKSIAKIVKSNNGQTNILLQKNATKTQFSQALENQSYQFVHIATHGLVNFKNPRLSALACYSKDGTMDNLMYANEIQFKDINADLVILSSCESGIGQLVEGEGLIALNRSFIYSGAKNVMFSLWKVSDKYSSNLMIDFYENYYQGQSYTEALRNAKLKMLSNPTSAQPKFWSAFVLMGQ